jgi:hypothetical protein
MDQITEPAPAENDEQQLAGIQKVRLARFLLDVAYGNDAYAKPWFVRPFVKHLNAQLAKAKQDQASKLRAKQQGSNQ